MKLSQLVYGAVLLSSIANAANIITTPADRSALSMTIYANGLAMVQDQREVTIEKGRHILSYEAVSNRLNPSSALFGGQDLTVLQQVFDYALMSDANMLRLSEGKEVKLLRFNPENGEQIIEYATIITTKPQLVVETKRGIETNPQGHIIFTEIPKGLSKAPALKLFLEAQKEGVKKVDLTYLTNGLNWKADYIGRLNKERTKIEIRALATVNNNTEVAYENANMSVIAGDVKRSPILEMVAGETNEILYESNANLAKNEAVGNFQLFKLPEKITIESQQTRQFPLLPIKTIDAKQIFEASHHFYGQQESFDIYDIERPQTYVEFNNDMQSPMPAGEFRVYETDSQGNDHFTGENYIPDIAESEPVRLSLGESYNLRIYRNQTSWKPIGKKGGKATYEVKVTNASDTDAVVHLIEIIGGKSAVYSKLTSQKKDNQTYQWELLVPAKDEASITYTISTTQP